MKHYVYKITDSETEQYYYGSRSCEIEPENDDYMGSMKTWKPEDDSRLEKEIIKDDFKTREKAIEFEAKLIEKYVDDSLNENYHIPNKGFHVVGLPKTDKWIKSVSEALSGSNNPMYGKSHTSKSIDKIKEARNRQVLTERQIEILRTNNLGKSFDEAHKNKISKSLKKYYSKNDIWNKNKKMPESFGKKISDSKVGTALTDEHKRKLSTIASNREVVKCPHCSKKGQYPIMSRWHFENCKNIDT